MIGRLPAVHHGQNVVQVPLGIFPFVQRVQRAGQSVGLGDREMGEPRFAQLFLEFVRVMVGRAPGQVALASRLPPGGDQRVHHRRPVGNTALPGPANQFV